MLKINNAMDVCGEKMATHEEEKSGKLANSCCYLDNIY
jgi:hypothetical protein